MERLTSLEVVTPSAPWSRNPSLIMLKSSVNRCSLVLALLGCTGCAARKPVFQTYRLVNENTTQVLIPPGVATAGVAKRTFTANVAEGGGRCLPSTGPVGIQVHKKRAHVSVERDTLIKQQPGWLYDWATGLESHGCLGPHEGWKLAKRIVESLPLEANTAFRLLYASQMDVVPQVRIQVISPILGEGMPPGSPMSESVETSGNGANMTLTAKPAVNLIGYETTWYAVRPKSRGIGFTIAPLYAERHIDREIERRPQPSINYLRFLPEAAFYRLYHKAGETEFTQLILAARTRAELEQRVTAFETGSASCEKLNRELCIAIPKAVAINLCLPVTVNGAEIMVRWGANVGEAIRESGERQPNSVLPQLAVYKLYDGRPAAVEFDHASPAIFNLILTGGEAISWK
jgi:hypothetical protein